MSVFNKLERYLEIEMMRRDCLMRRSDFCPAPPNQFYVEPTNHCNNRCVMCVPIEKKRDLGYMPFERWRRIVDSMAKHKLDFPVTMIGRGEPLMHKELVEFVDYASRNGVPCYLITNGTLLTEEKVHGLLKAGIKKIQLSLHAHSAETFHKITGRNTYDKVKSNYLRFLEINKEMGRPCYASIMAVESSLNKHEVTEFQNYWTPLVDRCFVTKVYSAQDDGGFAEEAKARCDLLPEHPGCVIPWYFMGFRHNGNVLPCPFDFEEDFVIGNVDDPDFDIMELWNCERIRKMRQSHLSRDFSFTDQEKYPCRSCEVPRTPDNCKGIPEWIEKFHKAFARQYAPLIKD
ncbi:MAG: hypothetical protein A2X49_03565 [Lentisphaerae bacterium GWF2_52_8]|nr:MAG: hypothetical protein A2X49_03565 [Lentisphaerae bacterium GWF2_52_8]